MFLSSLWHEVGSSTAAPLDRDRSVVPTVGKRTLVQLLEAASPALTAGEAPRRSSGEIHQLAAQGLTGAAQPLPHLDRIQALFGRHDVTRVQAHVGGAAAEAASAMGAAAYATGSSVAFHEAPDLHTAAHEAAHVVQQRGGVQLAGGVGEDGDAYEQHANAVADKVVRGESAESLLDERAPRVFAPLAQRTVQLSPVTYGSRIVPGTAEENTQLFWLTVVIDYTLSGNPRWTLDHYTGLLAAFERLPKRSPWDLQIIETLKGCVARAQLEVERAQQPQPSTGVATPPTAMATDEKQAKLGVAAAKEEKGLGPMPSASQPQPRSELKIAAVVEQAVKLAVERLERVILQLAPFVENKGLSAASVVRKVWEREGAEFMARFYANICKLHQVLGSQLAGKESFLVAKPTTSRKLGRIAETDQKTGMITLFSDFFDREALPQSDTLTHEAVHKLLGVDDQAYKGTRIFKYLKPEFRLQNPDSYVELLRELDGAEPSGKDPGFSVQSGVQVPAAEVARDVALAQHVAQRGSYLLDACGSELAGGFPPLIQQSKHVQAYLGWVRGNKNQQVVAQKDSPKVLSEWATVFSQLQANVAVELCRAVKVVAVTDVKEQAKLELKDDTWQVTLFSGTKDRPGWIFVNLLRAKGKTEGVVNAWYAADAIVNGIEPYAAKFTDI